MDIQTPETLKIFIKGYENLVQMYETGWRSLSRPYTCLSVIPSFHLSFGSKFKKSAIMKTTHLKWHVWPHNIYMYIHIIHLSVIHTNCQFLCFLKIKQLNSLNRPFYILRPFKSIKRGCSNFVEINVHNIRQDKAYKVYIFFF